MTKIEKSMLRWFGCVEKMSERRLITHTVTPVFPEGLGRGEPIVHPQFAGMFSSHVMGGEPIANNRAQILTPSCY